MPRFRSNYLYLHFMMEKLRHRRVKVKIFQGHTYTSGVSGLGFIPRQSGSKACALSPYGMLPSDLVHTVAYKVCVCVCVFACLCVRKQPCLVDFLTLHTGSGHLSESATPAFPKATFWKEQISLHPHLVRFT